MSTDAPSTDRRNAAIAGVLLLLGFSGVGILVVTDPVLQADDLLGAIPGNENRLAWGAALQLVMAFSCSGIVVFLYPALARVDRAWATWALVLRSFETVLMIVAAGILLSLTTLGQEAAGADAGTLPGLRSLGAVLADGYEWTASVLAILAWTLGAAIYHVLFYVGRLIPRWLALWGIIGVPFAVAGCVLAMFDVITVTETANTLLTLPLGLQEIPLAIWLIVKGTSNSPPVETRPTRQG